jgi:hypothetical protein
MNNLIRKVNENRELYFMYALGFTVGVVATRFVFKQPKIIMNVVNAQEAVNLWLESMQAAGLTVYAFDAAQSELWKNCLTAAAEASKQVA